MGKGALVGKGTLAVELIDTFWRDLDSPIVSEVREGKIAYI